jgi:subtilase family serine protease
MKQKLRSARSAPLAAILAFTALVVVMLVGASASSAARPKSHPIHVSPQVSGPQRAPKPGNLFSCQARPLNGSQGPRCYTPQQIQQAYGYSGLLSSGVNGSGKTIVIIDAYDNPYLQGDLNIQDSTFGLPSVALNKVEMPGVPKFDPNDANQVGWGEEETLDVLWAHAMAPKAGITLVEAKSNNDDDILAATRYAVDNNLGDVISQSFGEAETCVDPSILSQEHAVFQSAVDKGMTLFASSGDSGASQFNCAGTGAILAASSPASDPLVTGVGGTTLSATDPAGMYSVERAWTEPLFGCNPPAVAAADINCSGGGFSTIYSRPSYQRGFVSNSGRGVPDVAYNAGVNGGVLTHCGVCNVTYPASAGGPFPPDAPIFFLFGGTSAGSPQWAALAADADQMAGADLGNINPRLYSIAAGPGPKALHDIVQGNNDVVEIGTGYNAGQGWDPVTGLGSPDAAYLLPRLSK